MSFPTRRRTTTTPILTVPIPVAIIPATGRYIMAVAARRYPFASASAAAIGAVSSTAAGTVDGERMDEAVGRHFHNRPSVGGDDPFQSLPAVGANGMGK